MLFYKHFMAPVEADDGLRLWVEPINLTLDLREWCEVRHAVPPPLAPSMKLWSWFQEHPEGYDFFRGMYHVALSVGRARAMAQELAVAGAQSDITLVHQSDDPEQNSATALHEFLSELQASVDGRRPS